MKRREKEANVGRINETVTKLVAASTSSNTCQKQKKLNSS